MATDRQDTPGDIDSERGRSRMQWQSVQWQSWIIAACIAPLCGAVTAMYVAKFWTPATRTGLILSVVFALVVMVARAARPLAALAGGVFTAALFLSTVAQPRGHWNQTALLPLLTLFVLTFAATRFGRSAKQRLGIAESGSGRNAAQVSANLGVAALLSTALMRSSVLGQIRWPASTQTALLAERHLLLIMITAALAEATADTVSSEVGEVLGGSPFLVTTGRRVPTGTDGAISLAGTATGIAAAAIVVLVALPALGLPLRGSLAALGAGVFGLFFDSVLGATLEARGWLNNDAVNFLSIASAAVCALALFLL